MGDDSRNHIRRHMCLPSLLELIYATYGKPERWSYQYTFLLKSCLFLPCIVECCNVVIEFGIFDPAHRNTETDQGSLRE